jgi:hypothetical protein
MRVIRLALVAVTVALAAPPAHAGLGACRLGVMPPRRVEQAMQDAYAALPPAGQQAVDTATATACAL